MRVRSVERQLASLLPRVLFVVSHALFKSCRIAHVDREHEDRFLANGHPIVFAAFHQGIALLPYQYRGADAIVMVSASRDGDLIAGVMTLFGLRTARGSTTRGGRRAIVSMIREVRRTGCSAGVIVDGPLGPPHVAQMGVIALARATGLPIVGASWWSTRRLEFGSWDRTILPLPFSRIVVVHTAPLFVPHDADDATMERLRDELTQRLRRAQRTAQERCAPRASAGGRQLAATASAGATRSQSRMPTRR